MSSTDEVNQLHIPLQELSDATNGFSNENLLAMGGFGKVYKGVSVKHGNIAVKMLDPRLGQGDHEFKTEIALLSVYKHENIVSLLGFCDEDGKKLLVYKFESKGSLDRHLKSADLTWIQRLQICLDAARGLQYLHDGVEPQRRILHRDVKSSNILLDENWKAKISDFGLSRMGPANVEYTFLVSNPCGTFAYIDPEYTTRGCLTQKSDVYSFGVVLFEVLCGRLACIMEYKDERRFLTTLITIHWKNNSLDKIINSDLRRQISRASLYTYSSIAYQCLMSGNERPTMEKVVKQLQKAFENQLAPSDTHDIDGDHFAAHFRGQLGQETVNSEGESLKDFLIPDYILLRESKVKKPSHDPPVIVFVDSKSGGQLGRELLVSCETLLNKNQVFDLNEIAPYKVLHQLYFNIEKFKQDGDSLALAIQRRLRIIVAGGDGTAGGILGVISDMQLTQPPPVATVPLGTGNNLPFAFGWGKKNLGTDLTSVKMLLDQVKDAKGMRVDSWHVVLRMKVPTREEGVCDPIPPLDLPHSLHAFHRVDQSDAFDMKGYHTFRGGFWNYFSMGMDAQVSYRFHTERKSNPEKITNQAANQSTYAKLTRSQFWASLSQPSSWNIAQLANVSIMRKPGHWEQLTIPPNIRSIICHNLPSFSGGLNPWGMPSRRRFSDREWTLPYVDDGFLEIVGFRNPWHGAVLYGPAGNGIRLAQVRGIRFEFCKGATDHTFMTMDGEPWKQPLPKDDGTVLIEISCFGQVNMLATGNCPSKSVYDPSTPHTPKDNECDSDEEYVVEDVSEEQREFGAIPPSFFADMASSSSFSVDAPPPY